MEASSDSEETPLNSVEPAQRAQVVLAALGILICTNGPSTYVASHVIRNGGEHTWISLYPFSAVAVGGAIGLARRLSTVPWRMWPWPLYPVGGYVAWAVLSGLWSVSPQTTAVQSIVGVGIAAFGAWFGWCLSARAQISAVVLAVGAAVVASALVVLFLPQYGKMYPDLAPNDRWQGIFGNRNSLAPICALLLIALVGYVALHPTIRRIAISLPLAVSAVVLLRGSAGATSVAALLATAVATIAVPFVWLLKRTRVPAAAVATGATVSLAACWLFVMTHIDRVASWMSRDATLTGRRPIWSDVRSFIRARPFRGYGFWAFWDRADLTAATYARLNEAYGSAHNSALEVMLGLGVIGLILYLIIVLAALAGVATLVWTRRSVGSFWWAMVLAFLVVQNLMESFVLWHSYNWVLFIAAAFVPFGALDPSAPTVKDESMLVAPPSLEPRESVGAVSNHLGSVAPRR